MASGDTPEGHTPEKPAADEYGKPGTPAAGLRPEVPHAADAEDLEEAGEHDGAADARQGGGGHDHARDAGHGDETTEGHDTAADPLGPIDWRAWGASLLGIAVAALVGLALALPTLSG